MGVGAGIWEVLSGRRARCLATPWWEVSNSFSRSDVPRARSIFRPGVYDAQYTFSARHRIRLQSSYCRQCLSWQSPLRVRCGNLLEQRESLLLNSYFELSFTVECFHTFSQRQHLPSMPELVQHFSSPIHFVSLGFGGRFVARSRSRMVLGHPSHIDSLSLKAP